MKITNYIFQLIYTKLYEIIIAYESISNFPVELKIIATFELYSIYNLDTPKSTLIFKLPMI